LICICVSLCGFLGCILFFFQAEDGIRDFHVTGVQTCALPISTVRLKHLLTTSEVVNELGNYTTGWKVNDLNVTNVGEYPTFPYRSEERRVGKECRSRRSTYH